MNQENYNELAKIINEQVIFAKGLLTGKEKENAILLLTAIAYKQANYFEKEYPLLKLGINKGGFNRLLFLKGCGINA